MHLLRCISRRRPPRWPIGDDLPDGKLPRRQPLYPAPPAFAGDDLRRTSDDDLPDGKLPGDSRRPPAWTSRPLLMRVSMPVSTRMPAQLSQFDFVWMSPPARFRLPFDFDSHWSDLKSWWNGLKSFVLQVADVNASASHSWKLCIRQEIGFQATNPNPLKSRYMYSNLILGNF